MDKKVFLRIFTILLIVILVLSLNHILRKNQRPIASSIGIETLDARPTPNIVGYGTATQTVNEWFPFILNCKDINVTEIYPGKEWQGIQIGNTTFDQLVKYLNKQGGEFSLEWDHSWGHVDIYSQEFDGSENWLDLEACFIGDTLVALSFPSANSYGFPGNYEEIVATFGQPDLVTWGWSHFNRSLVWYELGILIDLNVEDNQMSTVLLFSPLPFETDNNWINEALPNEGIKWVEPEDNIDSSPLPPHLDVENPWNFQNRLRRWLENLLEL